MSTTFSEILSGAMLFMDDARWQEQLATNPAQFYRAKSANVIHAIPRFNCPPNIQYYLTYESPAYTDYEYTATEETSVVHTGITGYELCTAGHLEYIGSMPVFKQSAQTYDPETGDVTFEEPVPLDFSLSFDFYSDGEFHHDLDDNQKRILSLATAVDWYFQFANDYLGIANLVVDKSFSMKSPSEHIRANTERLRYLQEQLRSELFAYEQRLYKVQTVPANMLPKI